MGSIEKRPIVDKESGVIKIANMCTMIVTGDSRYGDAACMNPYFQVMRGFIEDPENFNSEDEKYWDHQ